MCTFFKYAAKIAIPSICYKMIMEMTTACQKNAKELKSRRLIIARNGRICVEKKHLNIKVIIALLSETTVSVMIKHDKTS